MYYVVCMWYFVILNHRSPSTVKQLPSQEELCDWLTLHSLLWIQEGKGITLEPHSSHDNQVPGIGGRTNLFLVCRMFWCEEVSKSPVCWGTNHPQFGFKQVKCDNVFETFKIKLFLNTILLWLSTELHFTSLLLEDYLK